MFKYLLQLFVRSDRLLSLDHPHRKGVDQDIPIHLTWIYLKCIIDLDVCEHKKKGYCIELGNILTCHSSRIPRRNELHIAFRPGMYIDPVGILYYKT